MPNLIAQNSDPGYATVTPPSTQLDISHNNSEAEETDSDSDNLPEISKVDEPEKQKQTKMVIAEKIIEKGNSEINVTSEKQADQDFFDKSSEGKQSQGDHNPTFKIIEVTTVETNIETKSVEENLGIINIPQRPTDFKQLIPPNEILPAASGGAGPTPSTSGQKQGYDLKNVRLELQKVSYNKAKQIQNLKKDEKAFFDNKFYYAKWAEKEIVQNEDGQTGHKPAFQEAPFISRQSSTESSNSDYFFSPNTSPTSRVEYVQKTQKDFRIETKIDKEKKLMEEIEKLKRDRDNPDTNDFNRALIDAQLKERYQHKIVKKKLTKDNKAMKELEKLTIGLPVDSRVPTQPNKITTKSEAAKKKSVISKINPFASK